MCACDHFGVYLWLMEWWFRYQERDGKNFHRLCEALTVVGFTEEDMDSIFQAPVIHFCFSDGAQNLPNNIFAKHLRWQVLAGLVHLGDLSLAERDESQESSTVELDEEILEKAV